MANPYDGMDPEQYRRDLLVMGADPEDAQAAVEALRKAQS